MALNTINLHKNACKNEFSCDIKVNRVVSCIFFLIYCILRERVMVFNATFNNISVISWRNRIFVFCPVERLSLIFQHFSTLFISLPKNVIYIFRKHVTILYNYRVSGNRNKRISTTKNIQIKITK